MRRRLKPAQAIAHDLAWSGPGMTLYVALVLLWVCPRVRRMDVRYD